MTASGSFTTQFSVVGADGSECRHAGPACFEVADAPTSGESGALTPRELAKIERCVVAALNFSIRYNTPEVAISTDLVPMMIFGKNGRPKFFEDVRVESVNWEVDANGEDVFETIVDEQRVQHAEALVRRLSEEPPDLTPEQARERFLDLRHQLGGFSPEEYMARARHYATTRRRKPLPDGAEPRVRVLGRRHSGRAPALRVKL